MGFGTALEALSVEIGLISKLRNPLMVSHPFWVNGKLFNSNHQTTVWDTPLKINIEPENDCLEDYFPFQGCICQVPCFYFFQASNMQIQVFLMTRFQLDDGNPR